MPENKPDAIAGSARLFASRRDIIVMDAPVSSSRFAVTEPLNVTGTMIALPLTVTGTTTAFFAVAATELVGTGTADALGSEGRPRKKESAFLDCSLSPCLIQPTVPLRLFTRYHLMPPTP